MSISLAVKYRPKTFDDVSEQGSVKAILENQISTNTIKHGYLFCGGAGTGKTTCARIFANEINKGQGEPIELDAASNNSVEDIRRLTEQAQTKSLDSEFKVFIIDECHSLSNQAWQAMLKTLEEPPASSIFIFCTTNPEKIPNTILSRVQRYNFQRISQKGIVSRLKLIIDCENEEISKSAKPEERIEYDIASLEYIAKIADGGMRDAITLMDKCLSYSKELSVANVEEALGLVDYQLMYDLTMKAKQADVPSVIEIINGVYASGVDLKLFVKNYFEFVLDFNVFLVTNSLEATKIPKTFESKIKTLGGYFTIDSANELLDFLVDLQSKIKWEQAPKAVILAGFMLYIGGAK